MSCRIAHAGNERIPALLGTILAASLGVAACEANPDVAGPDPAQSAAAVAAGHVTARATGGGRFFDSWFSGTTWQFSFAAIQRSSSGEADGNFRFRTTAEDLTLDIRARVTCMTFDPDTRRTWIGGVITQNNSTHPVFRDAVVAQVGQPTWFRAVDNGEGLNVASLDRTTRNFFTGAGGFQNEWEFCTADPPFWPVIDGIERFTDPLLHGNIQVLP